MIPLYVACCSCGWRRDDLADRRSAEVVVLYHEETAGKLRPREHRTYAHREDE